MTMHRFVASFFLVTAAVAVGGPPKTEKAPVTETFFGVQVTEDYRWL